MVTMSHINTDVQKIQITSYNLTTSYFLTPPDPFSNQASLDQVLISITIF